MTGTEARLSPPGRLAMARLGSGAGHARAARRVSPLSLVASSSSSPSSPPSPTSHKHLRPSRHTAKTHRSASFCARSELKIQAPHASHSLGLLLSSAAATYPTRSLGLVHASRSLFSDSRPRSVSCEVRPCSSQAVSYFTTCLRFASAAHPLPDSPTPVALVQHPL